MQTRSLNGFVTKKLKRKLYKKQESLERECKTDWKGNLKNKFKRGKLKRNTAKQVIKK